MSQLDPPQAPPVDDTGPGLAGIDMLGPANGTNAWNAVGAPPRPAHSPRGLLITPRIVERLVARELAKQPMSAQAKQHLTVCLSLQYYFGGQDVAYRETEAGVEVLAVGLSEIGQLMDRLPHDQRVGVILGQPESW